MKLAVYALSLGEERNVDAWVDSLEGVPAFVLDTGSQDNTVAKLRARGVTVVEKKYESWRFDTALNDALALVPDEYDVVACVYLDSRFEPGWVAEVQKAWKEDTTRAAYAYVFAHSEGGQPRVTLGQNRIHQHKHYQWYGLCHEFLRREVGFPENQVTVPITMHHWHNSDRPSQSPMPLLLKQVAEEPANPRWWFYLGREYWYHKEFAKARETLLKYLDMKDAVWDMERADAMLILAECADTLAEKLAWIYQGAHLDTTRRDFYGKIVRMSYERATDETCANPIYWKVGFEAAKLALQITEQTANLPADSGYWGAFLYDYGSLCAWYSGNRQQAALWVVDALKHDPENPRILKNAEQMGVREVKTVAGCEVVVSGSY